MSGAKRQAERRSASGDGSTDEIVNVAGDATGSIGLIAPEPDQEEFVAMIAKKRTLNMKLKEKFDTLLKPVVEGREMLLTKAGTLSNDAI